MKIFIILFAMAALIRPSASFSQFYVSAPGGISPDKTFEVCLKAPLHLNSFQGNMNKNNKVILQWKVEDNETFNQFEVQRSSNGRDFTTIALVFASEKTGMEDYMYYETVKSKEKMIYRLKMVDKQKDAGFSKTLVIQNLISIHKSKIKIPDNPVNDNLNFSFLSPTLQPLKIKIYDASGRLQLDRSVTSYEGNNVISIPLPSFFKPGWYVIKVIDTVTSYSAKFIKQ